MQLLIPPLVLLSHVAVVTAVTGCYSDRDKDHRPRENCTGAGFRDIPAGLDPKTKVLLFPKNLFTSLPWFSFQIFTELHEIDLTDNKVPVLTPSEAPVLPSLSVLRLGSNRLTSLSGGSFMACPALTELYLDNNRISSLRDNAFLGLSKLEILDLTSNQISVLPTRMLHPLRTIETLYLESNKIKVMPDDWFIKKEEVPYLYLSANPWACSCSLSYFHRYLNENELNVYVRDGPIIRSDAESVVCDSPQNLKGRSLISLEDSDLCPPEDRRQADLGDFSHLDIPPPYTTANDHFRFPEQPPTTSTRFWFEDFTTFRTWSNHFGSVDRGDGFLAGSRLNPDLAPTTVLPSTEGHPTTKTTLSTRRTTSETTSLPSTTAAPAVWETTTQHPPTPTSVVRWHRTKLPPPSVVTPEAVEVKRRGAVRANRAAAVFCFWLFAGCLLLCVASAACVGATTAWLVVWYRRVYKPMSGMQARRRAGGYEGVALATFNSRGANEGVMALYRSVLYVHREAEDTEGSNGEGGKDRILVNLEPGVGGTSREGEGESKERGVYRKTLYRLLSKEEELQGWRDVVEECRVSAGDVGRKDARKDGEASGGGLSRKRYSVILREEREEAGGGREELDWVVGGWEVKRGGAEGLKEEEPRSSWGEWLAHYLPSMPWGVATPADDGDTL